MSSTSPQSPPPLVSIRFAATAIALSPTTAGDFEVLMVRRNPELSFGGMWTFPGGAVEPGDGAVPDPSEEDTISWHEPALVSTAARAAVREAFEETALEANLSAMSFFSHWIPPKVGPPKRFATWFFLAPEHSGTVVVDTTENDEARWVSPRQALELYAEGNLPLAIPTWITLDDLAGFGDVATLMDSTVTQGPRWYHTRALSPVGPDEHPAMCWPGDAGYESGDSDAPGPRNRVVTDKRFAVVERQLG